jgi:hypothetical protein
MANRRAQIEYLHHTPYKHGLEMHHASGNVAPNSPENEKILSVTLHRVIAYDFGHESIQK